MGFSDDDRILIENLYIFIGYGAKKLITEFPDKGWGLCGLNKLRRKLWDTGTTARRSDSGRPRTARIDDNINAVNDLVLSQEDVPKMHRSMRQIARETQRVVSITLRCTALFAKICDSNVSRNVARRRWLPPIVTHVWHTRRNCCVCTGNWLSTSSSSLTKRFSLSTFRTTAFISTCHSRQRSAMLPLTDHSVHVQRSASGWWCRSPCPSSGARSWFSFSPGLRSMAPITEMSCWRNTCCQQYDRSQRSLYLPAG